jgi:hypothetical protein
MLQSGRGKGKLKPEKQNHKTSLFDSLVLPLSAAAAGRRASATMARIVSRALPFASRSHLHLPPPLRGAALLSSAPHLPAASSTASLLSRRGFTPTAEPLRSVPPFAGFLAGIRGLRRGRRGQAAAKRDEPQDPAPPPSPPPPPKESEIELCARIAVEEDLPDDIEVLVRISPSQTSLYCG